MSHAAVTAIIFDYGKVLSLPPTLKQWERMASKFGVDQPTFQHQYWGFRDDYDRGIFDGPAYWRHVAEANKKTLANGDIEQLIAWDNDQWTNENPEMLDFARREKSKGVRIGILSNMQKEMLDFMRKKFAWLAEFDVQMYSCEEGIVKPEVEIYLECCRRLKSKPANTLFLDDKQPNIDGAVKAGLQALLFVGNQKEVESYIREC
jgi:putative hydrolase of the HAD superfamily